VGEDEHGAGNLARSDGVQLFGDDEEDDDAMCRPALTLAAALLATACVGEAPSKSEPERRPPPTVPPRAPVAAQTPVAAPTVETPPAPPIAAASSDVGYRLRGTLRDELGRALAGWTVEGRHDDASAIMRGVTDDDGRFEFAHVRGQIVGLTAVPPDGDMRRRRALTPGRVAGSNARLDCTPRPGGAVVGFLRGGVGAPGLGDSVVATWRNRTESRTIRVADSDGTFVIDDLNVDDVVDLSASCPGFDDARADDVAAGAIDVRLTLTPRVRPIGGRVVDADGRPAKLAWVRFTPVPGGVVRQAMTDFDGAFERLDTLDMDYDVRVMFRDPKRSSEPGEPMGVFHGGARGIVLPLPPGK
jgi:hypothetical protein